ncbi:MAG: hypothetical protein ACLQBA_08965 [Candidatus Binataceae bacterium]
MGDVMLTADEIRGLAIDLLISHEPPTGSIRLNEWPTRDAALVGAHYASELAKRT